MYVYRFIHTYMYITVQIYAYIFSYISFYAQSDFVSTKNKRYNLLMEDFCNFFLSRPCIFETVIPSTFTTSRIANEMYSTIYERASDKNI